LWKKNLSIRKGDVGKKVGMKKLIYCNIPPVSIGILPVIVPEELNSWKSKLMENIL
jgi:hypothetical protein